MNRSENLARLKTENFDICIIGGGASGAGCALDAALRGYKVAMIDKQDFASETSSRSTKLIHGGVRYLEQAFTKLDFAQLKQVRHGLEERRIVIKNAPHLARPLALLTPVFSLFEGLYYSIGLKMYDWFANDNTLPKGKWLSKKEVLARMPTLDKNKLHSAVLYYDGQHDDARYCLAIVQSAQEQGVAVANYVGIAGFEKDEDGKLTAANVHDELTGEGFSIQAKIFLNCTGTFADQIRHWANPKLPSRIRPSKGVHVVLPYATLNSTDAMLIPKTSDGRVVFAIPFEGQLVVGTTDTEFKDGTQEPFLEKNEVDFLLGTLRPYLKKSPQPEDVTAGFGGLRPLLAADPTKSTKGLTRDHEVEHDPDSNLVSLLGGKWTTYRLMAKDAVEKVEELLGKESTCLTADHLLAGGENFDYEAWKTIHEKYDLGEDTCKHLILKYGSRADNVVNLIQGDASLADRLVARLPYIRAEVVYAARHEMTVTPRDFLARRIRMEITDWDATLECLPTVCDLMAAELGWDAETERRMMNDYTTMVRKFQREAGG
ncbi:glycerol-3-phosphate dehydrogenase/oxidase [Persicitalea jodogahamensis]|uniref:Glycerol-3-phosphate dehydrogenase n=1 Tax=Persicitalea jodogahamensis TaxID=402147 RepID=A0A8J3D6Y2_9BACT|nr:FAD-dependent oxidoreductase [Persicitalea jodogahamensis]GHB60685.1 glycerol-3-phosphate dehydrogenase [Persicitalea jodogahamensis]